MRTRDLSRQADDASGRGPRELRAASALRTLLDSAVTRRRGLRSQERLVSLIEAGKASAAETHWRTHMTIVGRVLLTQRAHAVIDLMHHD